MSHCLGTDHSYKFSKLFSKDDDLFLHQIQTTIIKLYSTSKEKYNSITSFWNVCFEWHEYYVHVCKCNDLALVNPEIINPFSAGTALMLMQTGWIQASRRVTRRLAWDPTCLLLSLSFPIKTKRNLKVLKSRRQYNLFLENYPAFKGLIVLQLYISLPPNIG